MIYISYGIPKSASSFVTQTTREVVRAMSQGKGLQYCSLRDLSPILNLPTKDFADTAIEKLKDINCLKICERYESLGEFIRYLSNNYPVDSDFNIVLKTHLPASDYVRDRLIEGSVKAICTYQHPAEMILSRQDMTTKIAESCTMESLINSYKHLVADFLTWANIPGVRSYYYDDVVQFPLKLMAALADFIGCSQNISNTITARLEDKNKYIGQFNKGILHRAKIELITDELINIEKTFPELMLYIQHREGRLVD